MAEKVLDARGKFCPMPIVLLAKQAKLLDKGEQLTVLSDDNAFPPDVRSWCQKTGNKLISVEEKDGHFVAVVRKEV